MFNLKTKHANGNNVKQSTRYFRFIKCKNP